MTLPSPSIYQQRKVALIRPNFFIKDRMKSALADAGCEPYTCSDYYQVQQGTRFFVVSTTPATDDSGPTTQSDWPEVIGRLIEQFPDFRIVIASNGSSVDLVQKRIQSHFKGTELAEELEEMRIYTLNEISGTIESAVGFLSRRFHFLFLKREELGENAESRSTIVEFFRQVSFAARAYVH